MNWPDTVRVVGVLCAPVAVLAIVALWDALRRSLWAQVRLAELRVELAKREEMAVLSDAVATLRAEVQSINKAVSFTGKR